MRRRQKIARQRARARQAEARATLSRFGLSPDDPIFKLAVLTDDLSPSQTSYFAIQSLNRLTAEVPGVDVIVYVQHQATPCVPTACSVLDLQRFLLCNEPVVAVGMDLCLTALRTTQSLVFHYANNLDFAGRFEEPWDILRRAYTDPRVRVLARGEDHKRVLETEFEIQVRGVFPDLDLVTMLPTIVKEVKSVRDDET